MRSEKCRGACATLGESNLVAEFLQPAGFSVESATERVVDRQSGKEK
jgi:hypothetical protein